MAGMQVILPTPQSDLQRMAKPILYSVNLCTVRCWMPDILAKLFHQLIKSKRSEALDNAY